MHPKLADKFKVPKFARSSSWTFLSAIFSKKYHIVNSVFSRQVRQLSSASDLILRIAMNGKYEPRNNFEDIKEQMELTSVYCCCIGTYSDRVFNFLADLLVQHTYNRHPLVMCTSNHRIYTYSNAANFYLRFLRSHQIICTFSSIWIKFEILL